MGGLLGASFNFINGKLCKWRINHLHKHRKYTKIVEAVLVAAISSLFQFCLPLAFSCTKCDPDVANCPREKDQHRGRVDAASRRGDEIDEKERQRNPLDAPHGFPRGRASLDAGAANPVQHLVWDYAATSLKFV